MKPTPHKSRRSDIHFVIMILILFIVLYGCFGCRTPKNGCPNMADLRAGKYDDKYGWLRCYETGIVTVFDLKGNTICTYKDSN